MEKSYILLPFRQISCKINTVNEMKTNNVCKFTQEKMHDELIASCFVLETNNDVMREKTLLNENIAMIITKGSGACYFDEAPINFTVGDLLFGFLEESYRIEPKDNCEYVYVKFSGGRAKELFKRFNVQKNNRIFSGQDGLIPFWKESLLRADKHTIDLAAESILLYTFSKLKTSDRNKQTIASTVIDIMEENFTDAELSLSSIAKELFYNPKYLSHAFKRQTGISFSDYLNTQRIKYAVSLFDHGIDSVKNVAILSGFSDPLYFSTVFKKHIGISPKEYANSISKNSLTTD